MKSRRKAKHVLWQGKFRGCGYRYTVPREEILRVLSDTSEHLSAEEIYLKVREANPTIGLATVYRTVELLVEMGLLFKSDFGDGRGRYELVSERSDDHHHHLVCTNCRRVIDYTDYLDEEKDMLVRTEKGLSKKYNFRIKNHLVQFYGLCDRCQQRGGD